MDTFWYLLIIQKNTRILGIHGYDRKGISTGGVQ